MWIYDPNRTCTVCFETNTCFFSKEQYGYFSIHSICFLCKREMRNIINRKNYTKYKKKIFKRNKKWQNKNPKKYKASRKKSYINGIIKYIHKDNIYLTENI